MPIQEMTKYIRIDIRPYSVGLILAGIIALLIIAHSAGLVWEQFYGTELRGLIKKFDLGGESNIPAWFSSKLLLIAALLVGFIAAIKKTRKEEFSNHWLLLTFIFVFLSCDETVQIHEATGSHVHSIANLPFTKFIGWVIPYSLLVILFGAAYLRFFLHLPRRFKLLFASAGGIYVGGALGMELLTGAIGRVVLEGRIHFLFNILEESLEMAGIAVFIYALLSYLSSEMRQVNINFGSPDLSAESG